MKLVAHVRAVVAVPFDYDVPEVPEFLPGPRRSPDRPQQVADHEALQKAASEARSAAAVHAETEVAAQVAEALAGLGEVVSTTIEHVEEGTS